VVLFALLFFVILAIGACSWYVGVFDSSKSSELPRLKVDEVLKNASIKKNLLGIAINSFIFGNADKYVWRPPRVVPVYDQKGKITGYDIFGVVTSWDADARLLHIRSYTRKNLVVRMDPEFDDSIAVIAPMDRQGQISDLDSIVIVDTTSYPQWDSLFCVGDTVAVQVRTRTELQKGSLSYPVVPIHVRLEHRLCGT